MKRSLRLTQDAPTDEFLSREPVALLLGAVLDQQFPMERAFAGPKLIADRLGAFDARVIADMEPEAFVALCTGPPAVHRFPGSMAKRIQAVVQHLIDEYDGDVTALWSRGEPSGVEVLNRLKALPGFGDHKAKVFLALLGKQLGVRPEGWRKASAPYGEEGSRLSVADIVDEQSLAEVRENKKQAKAAAKAAK